MNATSDMSDIGSLIGQRLRAARTRARMSRRELAAVADVSERYLVQLEAGEANVSIGVLARVAGALSLDLPSLLAAGAVAPLQPAGIAEPLAHVISTMSLREQEAAAPVLKQYLEDRRRSMHGVALLGLRGAGKSTIGNLFAARHGMAFISVTREVEARAGMSLADLFNLGGPDAYRTLENEVVTDLARRNERIVLETAGGIVSNKEALDVILGAYKTVWLKASPQEHLDRIFDETLVQLSLLEGLAHLGVRLVFHAVRRLVVAVEALAQAAFQMRGRILVETVTLRKLLQEGRADEARDAAQRAQG